jgi:hypothetical protein
VLPVLLREIVEGYHPVPIPLQRLGGGRIGRSM